MLIDYNDGKWHGWNGGECPVHGLSEVEGLYWDNVNDRVHELSPYKDKAHEFDWNRQWSHTLLAFRVITPYIDPAEVWVLRGKTYPTKKEAEWDNRYDTTDEAKLFREVV